MSYVRVLTFFVCIGIYAIVYFYFLRRTRIGVAIRALISDPTMARVVGVDQEWITLLTFILASALAVPGSILIGWEEGFVPGSGFHAYSLQFHCDRLWRSWKYTGYFCRWAYDGCRCQSCPLEDWGTVGKRRDFRVLPYFYRS